MYSSVTWLSQHQLFLFSHTAPPLFPSWSNRGGREWTGLNASTAVYGKSVRQLICLTQLPADASRFQEPHLCTRVLYIALAVAWITCQVQCSCSAVPASMERVRTSNLSWAKLFLLSKFDRSLAQNNVFHPHLLYLLYLLHLSKRSDFVLSCAKVRYSGLAG